MLQLFEDKARNEQRALDKAAFADIGDPAVDDDARVEDFVLGDVGHLLLGFVLGEPRDHGEKVEQFLPLADRHVDADIAEDDADYTGYILANDGNRQEGGTQ